MIHSDKTYYIGGISYYSEKELIDLCIEKIASTESNFEREVYSFIKEWISPSETIMAKTSGSTGKPKEFQLQKKYMLASAETTLNFFNLKKQDKVLLCLPINFIAGKMMVVRALVGSLDLYVAEPSSIPEIPETDIEFSAMVPLQLSGLIEKNKQSISQIKKLIIGGSFIPGPLLHQIQNVSTKIWQTYGMTETMTHIAVRKLNGPDKSDLYMPLPGAQIITRDGRIVVNAPHLGVQNLLTNDLGEVSHNGSFKILGRADHVIISGGLKIHPEAIESKLSGIFDCEYMIGSKRDDKLGEKLVLFIEKGQNNERRVFQFWEAIEQALEKHKIPKEIIFVPEIYKTLTGKIDRNRVMGLN